MYWYIFSLVLKSSRRNTYEGTSLHMIVNSVKCICWYIWMITSHLTVCSVEVTTATTAQQNSFVPRNILAATAYGRMEWTPSLQTTGVITMLRKRGCYLQQTSKFWLKGCLPLSPIIPLQKPPPLELPWKVRRKDSNTLFNNHDL